MFIPFANPDQLIRENTPTYLVLARLNKLRMWGTISLALALVSLLATLILDMTLIGSAVVLLYAGLGIGLITTDRLVIFDASQQMVFFSTRYLLFERTNQAIPFAEIDSIYLDFEQYIYPGTKDIIHLQDRIRHTWFVFLTLHNAQTVTIAHHQRSHPLGQEPDLSKQTLVWERLATKICKVTGKFLIRTASVPGQAPRTFVDVIDQIVQRRLDNLAPADPLAGQSIRLRSHPTGSLEIIVNGEKYRDLEAIAAPAVRALIQEAVDEWHHQP
jgi:hypothetical protein